MTTNPSANTPRYLRYDGGSSPQVIHLNFRDFVGGLADAVGMRFPHHLRPGTLVAIEGPDDRTAELAFDKIWRAAHGLGHGSTPLFDVLPLFIELQGSPAERNASWRERVLPALQEQETAFVLKPPDGALVNGWQVLRFAVTGPTRQEPLPHDAVVLSGHVGQVIEGLFMALIDRDLYSATAFLGDRD
jgi:hypothetical protein